jgi:hypothetical protein
LLRLARDAVYACAETAEPSADSTSTDSTEGILLIGSPFLITELPSRYLSIYPSRRLAEKKTRAPRAGHFDLSWVERVNRHLARVVARIEEGRTVRRG